MITRDLIFTLPTVMIRINQVQGSSPREEGAMMLVTDDNITFSIGGGNLEWQAINEARAILAQLADDVTAVPSSYTKKFSLAASLGQCCGGVIELRFDLLLPEVPWSSDVLDYLAKVEQDIASIVLFGAGHIGRMLVPILANLGYHITWVDDRHDVFAQLPALADRVNLINCDCPEAEVARAKAGSYFLVMTYSHQLDYRIICEVLKREDFAFLGMVGSASKKAKFVNRLRQLPKNNINRLCCPLGIETIKAKHPAAIAVAIAAQLIPLIEQDKINKQQTHSPQMINSLQRIA